MWGSPGTILAGRELGLDVTASVEWLRGQRDADGLWTQRLSGQSSRCLGPAHGFAGCVLALGDVAGVTQTLEPYAVEEDGLVNWLPYAGMRQLDGHRDGQIRTRWCHGAPGMVATLADLLDEAVAVAGGELTWRAGRCERAQACATEPRGTDTRSWRCSAAGGRAVAHPRAHVRHARCKPGGAEPGSVRSRPLHAVDRRPRHGALPRRLRGRSRRVTSPVGDRQSSTPPSRATTPGHPARPARPSTSCA